MCYMILDVYDRCEWVDIYSKIYKDQPMYYHKVYLDAVKKFEAIEPDDCHKFGVYKLNITDKELKELRKLIKLKDDMAKDKFFNKLYEEDKLEYVCY